MFYVAMYFPLVVDHSIDFINNTGLLDDLTLVLTKTESFTTTERLTIYHTVTLTADLNISSSSIAQSDGVVCSSKNDDNTPIYVAVAITIVGLVITITILIVGVILCHRHQKQLYSSISVTTNSTKPSVVGIMTDLNTREGLE